ncbi:MAG: DMT family transporter [Chloroflexota bacterium]
MYSRLRSWFAANSGDIAMMYMVIVVGMNFVVIRDAVNGFSPLAFNALRFSLASLVIMVPLLVYRLPKMTIPRRDLLIYMATSSVGLTFMQLMLVLALELTTAANTSLMMATGPAWTVMLLVAMRRQRMNRYLAGGLLVMFAGTSLVILSGGEGLSLSADDLLGCAMMLAGAAGAAAYVVMIQPVIERNNSLDLGIIKHTVLSASLLIIGIPALAQLQPADLSWGILPNIAFAGLVASVSGTLVSTFAQRKIGPTRMKVYDNIMPISTAVFAFLVLGEPLTWLQVAGGALTIGGVMVVRRYSTYRMQAAQEKARKLVPARQT